MTTDETSNIGPIARPLAEWRNDDLMLNEATRERLRQLDPGVFAVLDWPEMREDFKAHDRVANDAKRGVRSAVAVILFVATMGIAINQLAEIVQPQSTPLKLLALLLSVVGGAAALFLLLRARGRSIWLGHRLWTERLRQLHFQLLIQHMTLAGRAVDEQDAGLPDTPALDKLRAERERVRTLLHGRLAANEAHVIETIVDDLAEADPWIEREWGEAPVATDGSAGQARLLEIIAAQRIDIQDEYTRKNLREGLYSPATRARAMAVVSGLFVVAALAIGAAGLVGMAFGLLDSRDLALFVAVQALVGAVVIFLKSADEGLAIGADAERYKWYLACIEKISDRFHAAAGAVGKVAALRDLEQISYREMRRFFQVHRKWKVSV